jgi:hypothetical protein
MAEAQEPNDNYEVERQLNRGFERVDDIKSG